MSIKEGNERITITLRECDIQLLKYIMEIHHFKTYGGAIRYLLNLCNDIYSVSANFPSKL